MTASAVRVPQMPRDSTSYPPTVVPSRWSDEGGAWAPNGPLASRSWLYLYGASSGAKIAVSTNRPVSTSPAISMPRCRPTLCRTWWTTGSWRQPRRRRWVSGAVVDEVAEEVAVAMSVPHPGVDERGDDVDDEVGDGDDDRQHGHDALHRDEVPGGEVLGQLEAQPLPFEGGLGQHGAAEQDGDLQADDRDDRDERWAVGVLAQQPGLRHAPGPGRLDVAGAQRADDVGAHQAQEDAGGQQAQRDRREDGVLEHVLDDLRVPEPQGVDQVQVRRVVPRLPLDLRAGGRPSGDRQPAQLHREDQLEHQTGEEDRGGVAEDREDPQ